MTPLNRVLALDDERGHVSVEAGIQWPELLEYLNRTREGRDRQWGIYQKQTGADRLSVGGALACNAHGRALNLKPIVQQVEAFDLVCPDGEMRTCSRTKNEELFRLAIGGYGLFGFITRVELRLRPRVKVRRVVELGETSTIMPTPPATASSTGARFRVISPCHPTRRSPRTRRVFVRRTGLASRSTRILTSAARSRFIRRAT
jgi:FAD/FMN-containing dehydrogenase